MLNINNTISRMAMLLDKVEPMNQNCKRSIIQSLKCELHFKGTLVSSLNLIMIVVLFQLVYQDLKKTSATLLHPQDKTDSTRQAVAIRGRLSLNLQQDACFMVLFYDTLMLTCKGNLKS